MDDREDGKGQPDGSNHSTVSRVHDGDIMLPRTDGAHAGNPWCALPSGKHAAAAQPAEVLVEVLAAADPLKPCRRTAAVAGRFGGCAPSVGQAASAAIDPTPIRRGPSLCGMNEPQLTSADVTVCPVFHRDSQGTEHGACRTRLLEILED